MIATPRRYRNREHLRYVARHACLICGRKQSDPHHLRYLQPRALGRKASDEFAVPLCRSHHRAVHRAGDERAWWTAAGIDPVKVARQLWRQTRLDHPQEILTRQVSRRARRRDRLPSASDGVRESRIRIRFIYVIFWLGLVPVQVLFGNVWRVLNPWRAIANGVDWIWRKLGQDWTPPLAYPERLGVWPAAVLLFCFAALELSYAEPASPRALALAIALYSYVDVLRDGRVRPPDVARAREGFTVYFGLLARIAPFGEHEGRLVVRWPFSGLAGREATPGMLAFVAVMLGSVGFDGLSRTPFWQDLRARVESPYIARPAGARRALHDGASLVGPARRVLAVALAYLGGRRLARRTVGSHRSLAPEFVQSLVPIALVYAVAHYFTLLVIQGQYVPRSPPIRSASAGTSSAPWTTRRTSRRSRRTPSGTSRWRARRRPRRGA